MIGSIQTRNYTDQQGNKRYVTEVVVDEANFVDSKSENQGSEADRVDICGPRMIPLTRHRCHRPVPPRRTRLRSRRPTAVSRSSEVLSSDDELPF